MSQIWNYILHFIWDCYWTKRWKEEYRQVGSEITRAGFELGLFVQKHYCAPYWSLFTINQTANPHIKIGMYFVPITMSFFYTHLVIAWSLKNKTWLFSFSRTHKKIFRFFLVHTIVCTHIIYITNTNKLILAPSAKSTVSFFFCPIGSFIISICSYFQGEKVCSHNLWNYKQEYLCLRSAFFPRLFCSSVINNIFWLLVVNYVKLQRGQCRNRQLFWAYELNFF